VLSSAGDIGSVTGLQLLVYAALGIGPIGAQRPVWHTAVGFLAGGAWALILILPGWIMSPRGKEQHNVAAVYQALADKLEAIGTDRFATARQAVTAALNTAYDELLTVRSISIGRDERIMRLAAALNASHLMAEASTALERADDRPPPLVIGTMRRLAEAVLTGTKPPLIPPPWDSAPGTLALRDAMAGAARALSGSAAELDVILPARPPLRVRAARFLAAFEGGRMEHIFTIRLMACILVAGVITEVAPLQRSYWVPLTVAIVFKPDYGSVFARALQRGIGTVVGAVLGAVLLVLVHGLWLLIPFAVLAALLPFGRSRNYGLLATFLTPLVVVLIDLLARAGWRLAEDRLIDTVIGCAIVLVIGFAPWWTSWYAHLPGQFARAVDQLCTYLDVALGDQGGGPAGAGPAVPDRSRLRRRAYRALADLRTEFQRTMSEPPAISRTASAWWPAVVGLEQVADAVTAVSFAVSRGAEPPPSAAAVRAVSAALRAAGTGVPAAGVPAAGVPAAGVPAAESIPLPEDKVLEPVTVAARALLGVLGSGEGLHSRLHGL
jgi:uncharacterized membrane protein YccC